MICVLACTILTSQSGIRLLTEDISCLTISRRLPGCRIIQHAEGLAKEICNLGPISLRRVTIAAFTSLSIRKLFAMCEGVGLIHSGMLIAA